MLRIAILTVALVAGGSAAYMFIVMQPEQTRSAVVQLAPQIQTRDVLVASADVMPGGVLTAENVRWQAWPEAGVTASFIEKGKRPSAVEEVTGAVVRSQFYEGEPIREGKLARVESGFLSAILPSGKRAMAIRVSAQSAAGGFILPNDRVDVLHTTKTGGEKGMPVTRAILRNVRVLAIDQKVEEVEEKKTAVGKTATLELLPGEVDILTAAEASGSLSLTLRSMADADESGEVSRAESSIVRIFRSGRGTIVNPGSVEQFAARPKDEDPDSGEPAEAPSEPAEARTEPELPPAPAVEE